MTVSGKRRFVVTAGFLSLWVVILGVLGWVMWSNRESLWPYLLNADYTQVIGVVVAYCSAMVAVTYGWSAIMEACGEKIGWWTHARIYCAAQVARRLPGTLWYIGGRAILYKELTVSPKVTALASGIEVIMMIITGLLVGVVFVFEIPLLLRILVFVGLSAGILLFATLGRRMAKPVLGELLEQRITIKRTILLIGAYSLTWLMSGIMIARLVTAFQSLSLDQTYKVIGAWSLSGTAGFLTFFLPSSFGVTELTLASLLSQIIPLPLAVVVAILSRLLTTALEVIVGIISYPLLRKSRQSV